MLHNKFTNEFNHNLQTINEQAHRIESISSLHRARCAQPTASSPLSGRTSTCLAAITNSSTPAIQNSQEPVLESRQPAQICRVLPKPPATPSPPQHPHHTVVNLTPSTPLLRAASSFQPSRDHLCRTCVQFRSRHLRRRRRSHHCIRPLQSPLRHLCPPNLPLQSAVLNAQSAALCHRLPTPMNQPHRHQCRRIRKPSHTDLPKSSL
ncbi:hypothetical protein M0R45_006665 [Rubus argutus]|uniref:Uncharacterized protein n=1 Tax=Rubus argutus TaxID=59490 RepID=A0AAW1YRL0_RUBAR